MSNRIISSFIGLPSSKNELDFEILHENPLVLTCPLNETPTQIDMLQYVPPMFYINENMQNSLF